MERQFEFTSCEGFDGYTLTVIGGNIDGRQVRYFISLNDGHQIRLSVYLMYIEYTGIPVYQPHIIGAEFLFNLYEEVKDMDYESASNRFREVEEILISTFDRCRFNPNDRFDFEIFIQNPPSCKSARK